MEGGSRRRGKRKGCVERERLDGGTVGQNRLSIILYEATRAHTHTHTHRDTHTLTHTHTETHTDTHRQTHRHIHTYTPHIHTNIFPQMPSAEPACHGLCQLAPRPLVPTYARDVCVCVYMCVCVCVYRPLVPTYPPMPELCVCVRGCVCVCGGVCVRACVR